MMYPKKKWGWKTGHTTIKTDRKKLVEKLDRVFSTYIRLRDSDSYGVGRCIDCGRPVRWNEGDAGHFQTRDRIATRWDERNVHLQHPHCNRFKGGKQYEHGIAIDKKYGEGTADTLTALANARGAKIPDFWIEEKIKEYRKKAKELKKQKE